jgi:hypothetical protein
MKELASWPFRKTVKGDRRVAGKGRASVELGFDDSGCGPLHVGGSRSPSEFSAKLGTADTCARQKAKAPLLRTGLFHYSTLTGILATDIRG